VLVIDMLNTYRHEDAEVLAPDVAQVVDPLAGLISRARERDDVELIYVNDNYGDSTADFGISSTRRYTARARPGDADCAG
jgi:nicotinamidase-related amidase